MMCTGLAKWDWSLLRKFILTWNPNLFSFFVGAKRRDTLCIITYYVRSTPYCLYISTF